MKGDRILFLDNLLRDASRRRGGRARYGAARTLTRITPGIGRDVATVEPPAADGRNTRWKQNDRE